MSVGADMTCENMFLTYTTPARGRAAKIHAAWHVSILAELSTHGGSIAL